MVLPGIQALFGFQLIAVFNSGFWRETHRTRAAPAPVGDCSCGSSSGGDHGRRPALHRHKDRARYRYIRARVESAALMGP